MNIGDLFNITGYDIVATAACDHGQVLVLNNNSSHYLVAESDCAGEDLAADGMHTVQRHPQARLVGSWQYGGPGADDAQWCYRRALQQMTEAALANISDGPWRADAATTHRPARAASSTRQPAALAPHWRET
jgi:hypothetical protein